MAAAAASLGNLGSPCPSKVSSPHSVICHHPPEQLLSEEDLQQGVLVLCGCPDVRQQRAAARLPPLDDALAAYQRFNALAAAAVAREGGDLIECQRCHFMILVEADAPEDAPCPNCRRGRPLLE